MSINSAMQSGITALAANSTALGTISNNIANSNTTGYKRILTSFTDLVSGGAEKSSFSSGGVVAVNRQTTTNQGELNNDTGGYSMGVNGQGFFVVSDSSAPVTSGSSLLFTRDGSFTPDTQGNLVNAGGYYLEGWPADTSGNIDTSATDQSKLSPINVSDLANKPAASTAITFAANLNSMTPVSTAASTTYAAGSNGPPAVSPVGYSASDPLTAMSTYDATTNTGTKPDSTISTTISDSLGQAHTVTISLLKTGPSTWSYEVSSPDITSGNTAIVPSSPAATADLHQLGTGTLTFDGSGNLTSTTGILSTGIAVAAAGTTGTTAAPAWAASTGAAGTVAGTPLTFGLGTGGKSTITQVNSDSTTTSVKANGTEFANLAKVNIGTDGVVTAVYQNGDTRTLAQVALATFLNSNGLTPVTGNAYQVSTDSGAFLLKTPGSNGAGSIDPNTLEASTVDLAQEFTGLITTQRAYSAASKIVTTADQMLQELLSLKQ
ncbi:flagellar hook protein FlgE [Asticcacaulis sp. EMRT-3]|uniref:flagellar hook protein FlgE n=1 Tax=Asticcacaulis sp. EMRT-3 TaxID=3040349 RepID=UPI0024AE88EA|nr:flagellar hook protein FlgE [Asticcacaulis sp. EMRT-3]MDI7775491.1 flagellar hook protein FlgE [Asticcacaulis sp. EMRT-3]